VRRAVATSSKSDLGASKVLRRAARRDVAKFGAAGDRQRVFRAPRRVRTTPPRRRPSCIGRAGSRALLSLDFGRAEMGAGRVTERTLCM